MTYSALIQAANALAAVDNGGYEKEISVVLDQRTFAMSRHALEREHMMVGPALSPLVDEFLLCGIRFVRDARQPPK